MGVVLRMQPGAALTLFSGDNREYSAVISALLKKKVMVTIIAVQDISRESHRKIHLAQAISKGDRMELVIQKAVELGAASITPLITARCVVRLDAERLHKKQLQWQAIAIAACEQSGRNLVPMIYQASALEPFLLQNRATTKFILDPRSTKSLRDVSLPTGDIALLIGPEGGLSDDEVALAEHALFQPIRLGPRILRTETAAIVAIGVLQALCGDL